MSTALIIGASRIGLETVKLALKAGHSVGAMARSATAIRLRDPKLEKLNGDALDQHIAKAPAGLRSAEACHAKTVSCAAVRFGQRGRRFQRGDNPNNEGATTATRASSG